MRRLATAFVALVPLVLGVASAAAATPAPTVTLSTGTIVPGQKLTVKGTNFPVKAVVMVSVCGADAVDGTLDCATTSTITPVAGSNGQVWARMTGAVPPQPCPCVVFVSGVTIRFSQTIPVVVVGATTAPVPPAPTPSQPALQIQDLRVTKTLTVASAMGAAAKRTVELRVHNAGPVAETPKLIGRWGHPTQVDHTISMPALGPVAPGATRDVKATFSLPALSLGTYVVMVRAQVVGFTNNASATTSMTQWPFGLFAVGALLLVLVVVGLVTRPRRRRRRRARRPPPPPRVPQPPVEPRRLASSAVSEARSAALSGR